MNKRTEITVETHRLLVIRRRISSVRSWCGGCMAEVRMITPNTAAQVAGVSTRTIYQWLEQGTVHFFEDAQGLILICIDSLNGGKCPARHLK